MPIIDRYLLRQFIEVFTICFISLTGLYVVIDAFSNLDEFMNAGKQGSLAAVLAEYYSYRALSFFDQTSGILTLIASMFTVTWIQRHHELTALEAAGISRSRVVVPVIAAVIFISITAAAMRELVIPVFRGKLALKAQDLDGSTGKRLTRRYDLATGILFGGAQTFADKQRISRPDFLLPAELSSFGKHLSAEDAFYQPGDDKHPAGYLLKHVDKPGYLDAEPSLLAGGKAVIITPHDAPWLQKGEVFVVSDVSFDQLEGGTAWRQYSSTADLVRGLRNPSVDYGADVRVAIHSRVVQPILDVTLLFLGLPLVLARENRNMFLAIGKCVGLVVVFMFVVIGCQTLGAKSFLNPALAVWLPLMIFVPWAVGSSEPLRE